MIYNSNQYHDEEYYGLDEGIGSALKKVKKGIKKHWKTAVGAGVAAGAAGAGMAAYKHYKGKQGAAGGSNLPAVRPSGGVGPARRFQSKKMRFAGAGDGNDRDAIGHRARKMLPGGARRMLPESYGYEDDYYAMDEGIGSALKKVGKAGLYLGGAYGAYKLAKRLRKPGEVPANTVSLKQRLASKAMNYAGNKLVNSSFGKKYLTKSARKAIGGVSQRFLPESGEFNLSPSVIPEYGKDHSVGPEDGESRETSKMNIPALLSAKTAGGHPFPNTLKNDPSNHMAPDVFRLSK